MSIVTVKNKSELGIKAAIGLVGLAVIRGGNGPWGYPCENALVSYDGKSYTVIDNDIDALNSGDDKVSINNESITMPKHEAIRLISFATERHDDDQWPWKYRGVIVGRVKNTCHEAYTILDMDHA